MRGLDSRTTRVTPARSLLRDVLAFNCVLFATPPGCVLSPGTGNVLDTEYQKYEQQSCCGYEGTERCCVWSWSPANGHNQREIFGETISMQDNANTPPSNRGASQRRVSSKARSRGGGNRDKSSVTC